MEAAGIEAAKISNGVFVESRDGYRISLQIAGPAL
jgi:hypothetical protein